MACCTQPSGRQRSTDSEPISHSASIDDISPARAHVDMLSGEYMLQLLLQSSSQLVALQLLLRRMFSKKQNVRRLRFSVTADFVRLTNYYIIIIIIIIIIIRCTAVGLIGVARIYDWGLDVSKKIMENPKQNCRAVRSP